MADAEAITKPVEAGEAKLEEQPSEEGGAAAIVESKDAAESEPSEKKDESSEKKVDTSEPAAANGGESKILKTKGSIDYDNFRNNRKFDPSQREISDDPTSIRKQVEFYFGDWNFPQDKFMWESCGGAENKPMPVKTLHSFKRMRTFQPYSAVVAALRDSGFLEVEGEEGAELVKRKVPYTPMAAAKAKAEAATVYVKGFGDETPNTQFDLESFFTNFGEVKGLKLRRTHENFFKGSVFVTFTDEETAGKFIGMDPAPKWNGHDLKVMSKHDYCEEKSQLIQQGKLEPSGTAPKRFFEGHDSRFKNSRGQGRRGGHRGADSDDWKKRREQDQKHGFQDRRGGRGRGRGRGRGGRDGVGRDGGGRNGHSHEREAKHSSNDTKPHIQSTAEDSKDGADNTSGKRARDEDGTSDEPAAKKVDVKAENAKVEAES